MFRLDYDVANRLACFDALMRRSNVAQGEYQGDARLEHTSIQQGYNGARCGLADGAWHVHALYEVQANTFQAEGIVGQHGLAHAGGGVRGNRAVFRDHGAVDGDVRAEVHLDDALDAGTTGDVHDTLGHVVARVVAYVVVAMDACWFGLSA